MAELKTQKNDGSVVDFINTVKDEKKREDSFMLVEIFEEITQEPATMRGKSIIGFGSYHYKSQKSKQEGDWMLTGFSPRKQQISLYIMSGFQAYTDLLDALGKHSLSTGCCLYIKRLEDVNIHILKKLIKKTYLDAKKKYCEK